MNKISRRDFISLSSCGVTFGISGYTDSSRISSIQANPNHMNQINGDVTAPGKRRVLHLHPKDNVAVALEDLPAGTTVQINNVSLVLKGAVAAKHKFALSDIAAGESIFMYGIKVGRAVKPIERGAAITTANIVNAVDEVNKTTPRNFKWTPPDVESYKSMNFMGYHRPDGKVGTANYWLVIPMVFCENRNVEVIKEAILSELGYEPVSPYRIFVRDLISGQKNGDSSGDFSQSENVRIKESNTNKELFSNVSGIQFLVH
ncbi:MAG: UxaA family hydrolase, partial [Bacteroidia bacterium]|nr:UxaA family hydrolase [Bacteroidia bacterium]